MSKRKKILITIIAVIVLLIVLSISFIVLYVKPYIKAFNVAKELVEEDYSYEIECYIEGVTLSEGKDGSNTIFVEGEKSGNALRSYAYSEKNAYLEMFADTKGNVIFNLKPFFEFISNKAEETLNINVGELVIDIDNTYVSLYEIEEVLDINIVSPDDFEAGKIFDGDWDDNEKYKIKKISVPEHINVDYNDKNSYFFQLTLLDSGTKVIVGIPKDDNNDEFYICMEKEDIRLETYTEYKAKEMDEIVFPKPTFTEEQIQNFKAVYKLWLASKEILDKLK